ncbi:hypothetical protein CcI156_21860 [Frankia sp. CcI156]|jgi:hypothetical protein|uniref:PIN domain-containing protein n=1 Tax=Frankia casuarinae (strain DSM 45818 / CECT 9043 / HFP020203 / CcI3) TaxID=106370 RepID=Q2J9W1_FRACC|nr:MULTISPECIES: hypothetical protein [Frankia]ABD11931.1 hypothetical protein Francci3_2569 [Frankia casuarinae]ESZ99910.1 hypothetical protein CcI6DRAFT_04691 [Frankia sp. CcI6]EYT89927.1 hypothetical protein ThrDRAFT_04469 [Frankia casuarinae]KDA40892.1 hypothetical protein BMG523Draft_04277 [Frankia sp. BMG5.23]KEZ34456.1 hypothetical protein CEDDRAFT_04209 [Frankia sp. CeD]
MIARTVVYDAGMLVALLRDSSAARLLHHGLRAAPHRPVVIGPVLAQAWRPDPKTVHAFSQYLKDCTVPQTRESASPMRGMSSTAGCVACARTFTLDSYKRAGAMLAEASLPPKKRPDVIDALVVIAAALHGPAQILTSDPDDIGAYTATLDRADIVVEPI